MDAQQLSQRLLQDLLEHRGEIFGYIWSLLRDPHAAEDVFQNCSLAIVELAQRETLPQIDQPRAWLLGVARHQVAAHLRQAKRHRHQELPCEEMIGLIDEIHADEDEEALRQDIRREHGFLVDCLQQLNQRARDMIRRRFVGGESYENLATVYGRSENALRQAILRARRSLMDCVERKGGERTA